MKQKPTMCLVYRGNRGNTWFGDGECMKDGFETLPGCFRQATTVQIYGIEPTNAVNHLKDNEKWEKLIHSAP